MELKDISYSEFSGPVDGDALIVVDMQNDFMPGGALPVAGGDSIIEGVNSLMDRFFSADLTVVLTQDWHPAGHNSFAGSHKGKKPYDPFSAPGIGPVLWPDHCVQGSRGADFHRDLRTRFAHAVVRKGYRKEIDSYSGFLENDMKTETGLDGYLKGRGVRRIYTCGLALDYCVFYTAVNGAAKGYQVCFIPDLTRPVGAPENSVSMALESMTAKGVRFIMANS
jgi:nicotinamidase/pyrazinamidase